VATRSPPQPCRRPQHKVRSPPFVTGSFPFGDTTTALTQTVLQRLEGFPQNLDDLVIPDTVDTAELRASLDSLVHSSPTPEARTCVVQVAAKLPPSRVLQNTLIQWCQDPGPSLGPVIQLIVTGLADSTFDRRLWLRAAATSDKRRARDAVSEWGKEHFEVRPLCDVQD